MDINRDVGRILLRLNKRCYEKGMKNISVSLKGVRRDKIAEIDRKVVIPRIIKSKEWDRFLIQFLKNIDDEMQEIGKQDKVKEIVNTPKTNFYTYENCDMELLYLYLLSFNDEKYDEILKEILDNIYGDDIEIVKQNKEKDIEELKQLCKIYEKEIEQLKTISRQRREKIKELEIKVNLLNEENEKLELKNEELKRKVDEKELELEEYKNHNEINNQEEKTIDDKHNKIAIIGKKTVLDTLNESSVDKILIEEFSDMQLEIYEKVLVHKKNIPIAKLRKLKKLLGVNGFICENSEEIYNYINIMGEANENRGN